MIRILAIRLLGSYRCFASFLTLAKKRGSTPRAIPFSLRDPSSFGRRVTRFSRVFFVWPRSQVSSGAAIGAGRSFRNDHGSFVWIVTRHCHASAERIRDGARWYTRRTAAVPPIAIPRSSIRARRRGRIEGTSPGKGSLNHAALKRTTARIVDRRHESIRRVSRVKIRCRC